MKLKYSYILAIILGIILGITVSFITDIKLFYLILGIIYFVCGSLFGFLWPKESWRWGIWIVGPMILLIALSILFVGQLEMFIKNDLPNLLLALISSCLGGFILAWYKNGRTKEVKK
jgi:peptidoglycan/LPS O-acetylase OafA/YrhL